MMFQYKCLNPISPCGTSLFTEEYKQVEELQKADAVLVRSAAMHDMQDVPNLLAVARAGAGVNNIPIADYSEKGIVVFNTPGANANGVKEMVIAGMLLASRDLIGGNKWVEENKEDPNITKAMEKAKKAFAGREIQNKKIGVIGLGAIGVLVANAAHNLNMEVYGYDPFLSVKSAWNLSRAVHHVSSIDEFPHLGASTEESEDNCAEMAVDQLMDYLENGNITNSVNYPNTQLGVCQTQGRIAILHRNIPNMLTRFTGAFAKDNINITEMSNKTKGDYAYAIFDVDSVITEESVQHIIDIEGVLKVRVVK